jgi:hypothetical protein
LSGNTCRESMNIHIIMSWRPMGCRLVLVHLVDEGERTYWIYKKKCLLILRPSRSIVRHHA